VKKDREVNTFYGPNFEASFFSSFPFMSVANELGHQLICQLIKPGHTSNYKQAGAPDA